MLREKCTPWLFLICVGLTSLWAGTAQAELVGWWKFDDGSGSTAVDSSGNGNHGTLIGGPVWGAEKGRGGVLVLDGADDHVVVQGNYVLPLYSMAVWFRIDSSGQQNIFGAYGASGELYGASMELQSDGRLRYLHRFPFGSSGGTNIYTDTVYNDGLWYHGAIVKTPDNMILYVNGEVVGTAADSTQFDQTALTVALSVLRHDNLQRFVTGAVDDLQLYDHPLVAEEILKAMKGLQQGQASAPNPADAAVDVLREVILEWTPGEYAQTHDVYLGASFADVNDAGRGDPGTALVRQDQVDTTFAPPERLDFGTTYYWRIDEVNAPPDNTIFKGDIWSFTVEPLGYPIEGIAATSNGISKEGEGPENTVNGSGLNAEDQHSVESGDMWLAGPAGGEAVYIQFEFDRVYKLHEMLVWNYNVAFELMLGFGLKDVTVEYSGDGVEWVSLGAVEFAQATALEDYTANTTVDFGGVAARYVKLTVNSGYGMLGQFGLSEVRFLYIPVQAREPQPGDGAADVVVAETMLSWRAGREAATHDVSLGTDPNVLALLETTSDNMLDPGLLDLATTYYWRVDEVNEAEALSVWEGDVWSFSTEEYVVVDDFESYDDEENRIFDAWIDGFINGTGSTVGYFEAPFAEQTIVHGGGQSMPFEYNNTGGVTVSEATRTFDAAQDWTQHGIKGLLIRFYGDPDNDAAQMYVKIDDEKVPYDGDAENLTRVPWQLWYVDLAGMNVSSVDELTIGIEGSGAGILFIDDIVLTPYERQQVTPVEPDAANLVAHFAFDGNTNDSTGAHPGTAVGSPIFVAGKIGQAISLNGTGDYVELVGYKGILGANPITVTAWVKTTNTETGAIIGWGPNVGGQRFGFRIDVGRLRHEHHGGNIQGDTVMNDGTWHHVAIAVQANATVSYPEAILWLDGLDDTRATTDPDSYDIVADLDVRIGGRPAGDDRFFMGEIDELYIYDRALSQAEIARLAGRTQPFDTPAASE